MRSWMMAVGMGLALTTTARAEGQGVPDGPLAAPATVPSASRPAKHVKKGPRHTSAKAHAEPVLPRETPARGTPDPDRTAATRSSSAKSDDPLSLGMKWNGSNDNGSQTRVQNYNGNAAGTGAEVGLKLHF